MRTLKIRNNANEINFTATVHEDFYVNADKTFAKGTVRHYSGKMPNGEYRPSIFLPVAILAPKGEKLAIDADLLKKDARVIIKGYVIGTHEDFTTKTGNRVVRDGIQIVVGKDGIFKANEEVTVGTKTVLANENSIRINGCMVSDLTISESGKYAYGRIARNCGKDKDGNDRPAAFIDINIFPAEEGKKVEVNAADFKKGTFVLVDGYLRNREYEKDGSKKTTLAIVVNGHGAFKANPLTEVTIDDEGNVVKNDDDLPAETI